MDVMYVCQRITKKIEMLEKYRTRLPDLIAEAAQAAAEYDKAIAVALVKLRNGVEMRLDDGTAIKDPPVGMIEKTAKGLCWKEKLDMDTAVGKSKACQDSLRSLQAELNGFQSVYKHLSVS